MTSCIEQIGTVALPAQLPNLPPSQPAHNAGLRTLTQADNDVDAVSGWLLRHQGSPHTFDSYKREAERLLAWCADRSQTLSQLMSEDMVAYQHFLQDPQPREKWCLQTEARYLSTGVINCADLQGTSLMARPILPGDLLFLACRLQLQSRR